MITAKQGLRTARAICNCDWPGCAITEDLACPLESLRTIKGSPSKADRKPDLSRAHKKLTSMGWRVDRAKIFCPDHAKPPKPSKELKPVTTKPEKAAPFAPSQVASGMPLKVHAVHAIPKVDLSQLDVAGDLRTPTREQKRAIMEMLAVCYDTKASRYTGDETDMSVAKAIGDGVMFGWVAQIREEFFGPIGSNAAIDELHADISEAIAKGLDTIEGINTIKDEAAKLVDDLSSRAAKATSAICDLKSLRDRLDRITAKLGPKA